MHDASLTKKLGKINTLHIDGWIHFRLWKGSVLYHMSDEDVLHLGSAEVTKDVRSKQRSHLKTYKIII